MPKQSKPLKKADIDEIREYYSSVKEVKGVREVREDLPSKTSCEGTIAPNIPFKTL